MTAETPQLIDPFARAITYLRVSVTDRCDFRCLYCMAEEMTFLCWGNLGRLAGFGNAWTARWAEFALT